MVSAVVLTAHFGTGYTYDAASYWWTFTNLENGVTNYLYDALNSL